MPGAYAHITIINHAQKRARTAKLHPSTKFALAKGLKYLELGAVSPDYPYLAIGQGQWADSMHYTNTAGLLRAGVSQLRKSPEANRAKTTAWFLGLAGHMASDMTIHPIVEAIVGAYETNKAAHRECEMHQDAFIFAKMDLGDIGLTQHLRTGIGACNRPDGGLDDEIAGLWLAMLHDAYPAANDMVKPEPGQWHWGFVNLLKAITTANRLFPFSRHIATGLDLTYPKLANVSKKFINQLITPEGELNYDAIFSRACDNVLTVWEGLDAALQGTDTGYLDQLEDWNLDTGKSVVNKEYVFWKPAA